MTTTEFDEARDRIVAAANQLIIANAAQRQSEDTRCEFCGLPQSSQTGNGYKVRIVRTAENRFDKDSHITVWCDSFECACQIVAVSLLGLAVHRWPLTYVEFREIFTQALFTSYSARKAELTVTKPPSEVVEKTKSKMGKKGIMGLPHTDPKKGGFRNAGGRPTRYFSNAEKQRAYRQRVGR